MPDADIEDTVSESGDAEKPMDLESSISSGDSTPSNNDVDQTTTGFPQLKTSSFGHTIKRPKRYVEEYDN